MDELLAYRDRFPILADTTYLISHSLGPMPRDVEDRLAEVGGRVELEPTEDVVKTLAADVPGTLSGPEYESFVADLLSKEVQVGYMKLHDPAVVRALEFGAEANGLGPIRSIEVTVLHPTSAAQLAHARLLPPAGDVPADVLGRLEAEDDRLRSVALGAAAASIGRLYSGILLGSIATGKYVDILWPIFETRLRFPAAFAGLGRTQPLASQFISGDQNIINMRVVVQYSVDLGAVIVCGLVAARAAIAGSIRPRNCCAAP